MAAEELGELLLVVGGGGLDAGNELGEEDGGLEVGVLLDISSSSFWAVSPTGFNFEREARILDPREEGGFSSRVEEEEAGRDGELVAEKESADAWEGDALEGGT